MTTKQQNPQNPAFLPLHGFVSKSGVKNFLWILAGRKN